MPKTLQKKKTKADKWFEEINNFRLEFDDLPDGAFYALAEEHGIEIDDWAWFADECERRGL